MCALETPVHGAERRAAPRRCISIQVVIEWGAARPVGTVRNLSSENMLIELAEPLWIGATFVAHLQLSRPLTVHCTVRRVDPHRGIGVTFTAPKEKDRDRLKSLLEALLDS